MSIQKKFEQLKVQTNKNTKNKNSTKTQFNKREKKISGKKACLILPAFFFFPSQKFDIQNLITYFRISAKWKSQR